MQTNSVMRQAFDNILVKNVKRNATKGKHSLVDKVMDSLQRKVGLVRTDEWNARLSFKTFTNLNGKGGWDFQRQPRMAFDDMVNGKE